jgi:hypothetical protein
VRNRKVSRREALSRVTRTVSGEVHDMGCLKAYCLKRPTTEIRSASFQVDSTFFLVDFSVGVLLILKFIVDSTHWVVTLPGSLPERVVEFWCPMPLLEGQQGKAIDPTARLAQPAEGALDFFSDSSIGSESGDVVEVAGLALGAGSVMRRQ